MAAPRCTIQCERLFKSLDGEGEQRLEYETLFALGPLLRHQRSRVRCCEAARLCDHYGLDTISTGGTLAWAMETRERGLLPEAQRSACASATATALLAAIRAIAAAPGRR